MTLMYASTKQVRWNVVDLLGTTLQLTWWPKLMGSKERDCLEVGLVFGSALIFILLESNNKICIVVRNDTADLVEEEQNRTNIP